MSRKFDQPDLRQPGDHGKVYHGAGIILPQSQAAYPAAEFLDWHQELTENAARALGRMGRLE